MRKRTDMFLLSTYLPLKLFRDNEMIYTKIIILDSGSSLKF
jgi:hypothetical protein